MKVKSLGGLFGVLFLVLLTACGDAGQRATDRGVEDEPGELVVFAAASLRDALGELAPLFEDRIGVPMRFNFAGSNVLARQIAAAPGADVFLSADEAWVDRLAAEERLVPGSRRVFLSNRLVVVGHHETQLGLDRLADLTVLEFRWLALGDPLGVPAGRYSRSALDSVVLDSGESLWRALEPRVAPTADVRAALAMVEAQPGVLGIVYRSDAVSARSAKLLFELPEQHTPDIRYVAALVRDGDEDLGRRFLDALRDPAAVETFERRGFEPPIQGDVLPSKG